jgi:hypothetical protein
MVSFFLLVDLFKYSAAYILIPSIFPCQTKLGSIHMVLDGYVGFPPLKLHAFRTLLFTVHLY